MLSLLNPHLLVFATAFLWLTPALAAGDEDSEPDPKTLLVWGPAGAEDRGEDAARILDQLLPGDVARPARTIKIADWLGRARFRLGGSATSISCATAPGDVAIAKDAPGEIQGLNTVGRSQLDNLDHAASLTTFRISQGRIPCQSVFVPLEAIWEAYFYGGIAAYYTEDTPGAREMFRKAVAISPSREWDSSYPPDPQSTFLSAVKDVIARPKAKVYGDMRSTNYREVWLDGEQLDLTKAFEKALLAGDHLVQAVDDQGQWSTWMRRMKEGATLTFFSGAGAEQMLLEGPDGVLANVAASSLGRRARKEKLKSVYIVAFQGEGAAPKVVRYEPASETWTKLEMIDGVLSQIRSKAEENLTPKERDRRMFLRDPDYRHSVAVGFKFQHQFLCSADDADSDGICPDGQERTAKYIGTLIGIDVNLIKGLNLDIRFGATVSDWDQGGVLLPEVTFGVRYRFLQGVLQPWIAVAADVFFGTVRDDNFSDDQFTAYAGVIPYGGLDLELGDGFRLTFEGGYGIIIGGEGRVLNRPMAHVLFAIGRFIQ
jgi:hypothetical protein